MTTVDHQQTAADLSARLDTVAAQAHRPAVDMQAAVDALTGLVESAGRLRARLESAR